ncbi:MAG: hypothetical protein ACR2KT_17340 [Methylocella sp.]
MTATAHVLHDSPEQIANADWLSLNDDVLRLGLLWIGDRLAGEFDAE